MSEKKKKKFKFPSAFTVLFIVLVLASILTYLVPAGSYDRLEYNKEENVFIRSGVDGEEEKLPATQEAL